ncbi:hypothetical protein B0G74_7700 [Paraburkholderia sp. BL9I2N2]|jgi:hypothetical protein|nr:hypothetical protein B0G74_7700 [Paraburkholderia sp. BL9I2N2]
MMSPFRVSLIRNTQPLVALVTNLRGYRDAKSQDRQEGKVASDFRLRFVGRLGRLR